MITIEDLDRVLGWMLEAGLTSVSVAEGEARLTLKLAVGVAGAPAEILEVTTKGMGTFLASHPRRPQNALQPGDAVAAGATVGFLQAGPVLVPVITEAGGRVTAIIAQAGALLGYGAPVLTLEQAA